MTIKIPKFSPAKMIKNFHSEKKSHRHDVGVGVAFVAAISILLLVAGYVISRMSSDHAHHEKWKDYNDCGWA